jgi:hypothetical protein
VVVVPSCRQKKPCNVEPVARTAESKLIINDG